MYELICYVDGMLVGNIVSSVIPRIGESIYVDNIENSLLARQTWDVLHVNYTYQFTEGTFDIDNLKQVIITLIETKTIDGSGTLSISARQAKQSSC